MVRLDDLGVPSALSTVTASLKFIVTRTVSSSPYVSPAAGIAKLGAAASGGGALATSPRSKLSTALPAASRSTSPAVSPS